MGIKFQPNNKFSNNFFEITYVYKNWRKKNFGEKKFWTPSQRKQEPEMEKTLKMVNFRRKKSKYDRKIELLKFFMMNPLKGSEKRTWAKNYNFSVIFSWFIGSFRVKKAYFGGFAPYIDEYLTN